MGTQLPSQKGAQHPHFSAHVRCGQTDAYLTNCRAFVLSCAVFDILAYLLLTHLNLRRRVGAFFEHRCSVSTNYN